MADIFIVPGKIISGSQALSSSTAEIKKLGKKALLVTDATMEKLGNLKKVTALLEEAAIDYAVYPGINGEPHDGMVMDGVEIYHQEHCDFLIALGGGSPIDAMKAIALIVTHGGKPADYLKKVVSGTLVPMVAIPTTAGTGSEATQFTIITDRESSVKMLLKNPAMIPDIAVIDPQFTMTAPPDITAATGIDALCHAVEAYTSKRVQALSETFALSACQRIFKNLRTAWNCGNQEACRIQMSLAALEAGIAFNNSSVTIVHGMSRPIGALFHIAHGISNAILLNVCLEYIVDGAPERFADIAVACGFADETESASNASAKLLKEIKALLEDIKIPTLEQYGINKEDFMKSIPKMAADAYASGSPSNTRKEITIEIMEELYRKLWEDRG